MYALRHSTNVKLLFLLVVSYLFLKAQVDTEELCRKIFMSKPEPNFSCRLVVFACIIRFLSPNRIFRYLWYHNILTVKILIHKCYASQFLTVQCMLLLSRVAYMSITTIQYQESEKGKKFQVKISYRVEIHVYTTQSILIDHLRVHV